MGKKSKLGVEKVVKKVNRKFDKASAQVEQLISDAFHQLNHLQQQVQEPVRRLLEDFERLREKELQRFQDELDRRLKELHDLQQSLLKKVGLAGDSEPKSQTPTPATTSVQKPQKAAPKANTEKTLDENNLTLIKGIGPATAKKLMASGITSIHQIAHPTDTERAFISSLPVKGAESWEGMAKMLLSD